MKMLVRKVAGLLLLSFFATIAIAHGVSSEQKAKPIIVCGKVLSPKANATIALAVSRVGFQQEELRAPIDAAGNFVFRFSSYVPTDAWLVYKINFLILFHPGDSLYLELDGATDSREAVLKTVRFSADAAAVNQKAALFQQLFDASSIYGEDYRKHADRIKRSTPDEFVRHYDSLRKKAIDFQEAFVKREKPGREVAAWSRLYVEGRYFSDLTSFPGNHRAALALSRSEWNVPSNYFDFLGKQYDIRSSLVSGDAIDTYMNRYTYRYVSAKVDDDIAALKRSMTGEQKDSMLLQGIVRYSKDAFTQEVSLCYFLNALLEQSAIGTFEKNRGVIDKYITQSFLREPLLKKYQEKKKEIRPEVPVTIAALQSGVSFVDSVLQHNKGKIIYIDFWATWCGGCREEFPYAKKLEDAFPEGVVFLYLCLESNEDAYRNLVKTYGHKGTHRLLDRDQSGIVRQKYKIDAIPHYMLIDREGKLVIAADNIKPSGDNTEAAIRELVRR
jgi:thiol-disulfide isomerase/thioredoxin